MNISPETVTIILGWVLTVVVAFFFSGIITYIIIMVAASMEESR